LGYGLAAMQRRPGNDEVTKARLFGKRAALVLCGTVAAWFIVASVAQIVPPVFGAAIVPLAAGSPGTAERDCADGLRRALRSDGTAAETPRPEPDPLLDESALAPCTRTASGLDALAALNRLRMAERQVGMRDPASLVTLRLELSAHLPVEMR
jgi:hypothetical protein